MDDIINVAVFRQGDQWKENTKIYERKFKEGETSIIYLMGYKGDDKFFIDQSVTSKIKIYMYGGEGCDEYSIKGRAKNKIYELKDEKNIISKSEYTKVGFE
jgi:hypothetical protein